MRAQHRHEREVGVRQDSRKNPHERGKQRVMRELRRISAADAWDQERNASRPLECVRQLSWNFPCDSPRREPRARGSR